MIILAVIGLRCVHESDGGGIFLFSAFAQKNRGAIRTTIDGITFDSKAEANRYALLKPGKGGEV